MKLLQIVAVALLGALPTSASPTPSTPQHDTRAIALMDALTKNANDAFRERELQRKRSSPDEAQCTLATARVRKDWAKMTGDERKKYTRAVNCMFSMPSRFDKAVFPGVRTRYDDFVAHHIDTARIHHASFDFLSFHRYFVWAYESELRDSCGYDGAQPYWDWFSYVDDVSKSPLFDGSDTSMGGDGDFLKHNGSMAGRANIFLPSGRGGGCVTTGPFVNVTVNLGPIQAGMDGQKSASQSEWNPRCINRDLTSYASKTWWTYENLYNLTYGPASADISVWQDEFQGRAFDKGFLGMHATGHYVLGGNSADFWSSTNDPAFWLHHAMVDRLWLGWQAQYPDRGNTVAGTHTLNNSPPSPEGTLDDMIDLSPLGWKPTVVRGLMDPMAGEPLCYIYV